MFEMKIREIKSRGILFTYENPQGCDLNLYLIKGYKNNYIIDTGYGSLDAQIIKKYLEDDIKKMIVINTHYHFDHIWGNGEFENCLIISHKLCREKIKSEWEDMMDKYKHRCRGNVKMILPDLTFDKELYFADEKIKLFYSPGHSVDSISILDEQDKVLIVADNIGESIQEIIPTLECKNEVYLDTLRNYEKIDFDLCISGHNEILKKDIISEVISIVESLG